MFTHDDVEYIEPRVAQQPQRYRGFGADTSATQTGFFSSPIDLYEAGKQTNDAFMQMFNAVNANRSSAHPTVPKSLRDDFVPFAIGWNDFYQKNLSSTAVVFKFFTTNLQQLLVNYQQQIAAWGAKLKKYIGADASSAAGLKPGSQGVKNIFMWIGIGVVALGAIYFIAKAVRSATLGGAALEEAEQDAMRIAEEKKRKKRDKTALTIS